MAKTQARVCEALPQSALPTISLTPKGLSLPDQPFVNDLELM
ncbi:hypothetical protein S40293_11613 [Stachybotrys chartarum IBT 40293]|nr:hypothetical protein S40293_11613 [Stachybotrys chartarum IBT 40293]